MLKKTTTRRSFLSISAMTAASLFLDWKSIAAYAASMGDKSDYPTVVIGAGLGGLSCAAHLAKQGIPVTVVEHHFKPGGYATSFSRGGGKYTFEVSLHGTAAAENSDTRRMLEELGALDHMELVELPEFYRLKTPTVDLAVPQKNPEGFIEALSTHFPDEKDGIRGFVQEMVSLVDEVESSSRNKGKYKMEDFPKLYPIMWDLRGKTLAEALNKHTSNPAVQDALASIWAYYGLPPSRLPAFYYMIATGQYLTRGSYYVKRRSQDLSNALAAVIENHGGKIRYGKPVESIQVENGAVTGVVLSNEEALPARAVVSNANTIDTFEKMLPREVVPTEYLNELRGYKPSFSTFLVWLGLNQELRGKVQGCGIYITSGRGPEADYESSMKGEIDTGMYAVSVYDNAYEGYSEPGTSSVVLLFLCGYEPWRMFETDYRADRKDAYNKEKERWANILIQRAEKDAIPGLSSMIAVRDAATPLTNWRYTRNPGGAIYGYEPAIGEPYMKELGNRTPIKGLYLAGVWCDAGAGYGGALGSGRHAFQAMMEDWGTP